MPSKNKAFSHLGVAAKEVEAALALVDQQELTIVDGMAKLLVMDRLIQLINGLRSMSQLLSKVDL